MSDYYAAQKLDGSDCPMCDDGTCHKKTNFASCDSCSFEYP